MKRVLRLFHFLAAFVAFLPWLAPAQQPASPGQFDYYLLSLSWSPEYCYSHRESPECSGARHYGFIVHGLWPEFRNGGYPEHCSTEPGLRDPQSMLDIMPDMGLIQHEWTTHGTCSGLSAQVYFSLIRQAFNSIEIPPRFVSPSHQQVASAIDIKMAFVQYNPKLTARDIRVSCERGYFRGVEICVTKDLRGIECPGGRECYDNRIRVAPVR
ncbi:MAG TPA: ribonuclease T2 [Bryobacteraceae bacterium]|jgi:ribonuclease T2|nr:ribonuclease T2 [Bryobacteraceae bacterium]